MSKRNFQKAFLDNESKFPVENRRQQIKKHTLDSDEEDEVDEDNVLNVDDIEGEEEGIARKEGEQVMTAFNMNEEMEDGHFDKEGHFIWNNEKEVRDNWLDNIDWHKIKSSSDTKQKYNVDEQDLVLESDSEPEDDNFDEMKSYESILSYLKPKETINKAIKRLAGADMKLSSVERLKRKKAGTLNDNKDVTNLTELANKILTKLGNMDIYQETYEGIKAKLDKNEKKSNSRVREPELDMYSDDFEVKEKEKFDDTSKKGEQNDSNDQSGELMWEFKWKIEDEEIHGPYPTSQMTKWSKEKYFKTGVMVRKCGDDSKFYTSNRIDFELYE
nr:CD2 antigen cytoplasmic tail-binding protein 2 homolog [Leptinotarsa decemlineata]